ncbi:MAG: nitrate- and nitrite sensing domain-containing protein [Solirubrobacterales bacterium]
MAEATATVHELQRERGLSVAAATKGDAALQAKRKEPATVTERNRVALDSIVAPLLAELPEPVRERWRGAEAGLKAVETLRAKIDAGGVEPAAIAAAFGASIDTLVRFEESAQVLAVKPDVARDMTALLRISRTKEAAGQERAAGAAAILLGTVGPDTRKRLMELAVEQSVRLSAYSEGATAGQRQALDAVLADPQVRAFEQVRGRLAEGDITGVTAESWFDLATNRIDRLHQIEELLVDEIRDTARARKTEAWSDLALFTGLTGAAMAVGALLVLRNPRYRVPRRGGRDGARRAGLPAAGADRRADDRRSRASSA